jgi:phosphatidylinositol glycan class B
VNVPCALKEWQNFFLDEQVDLWMKLTAPWYDRSIQNGVNDKKKFKVLFCILIPYPLAYHCSYLHRNVSMRFLTCEPNLSKKEHYIDEADDFYNDPLHWLKKEYHFQGKSPPSHIVYFNVLKSDISQFLTQTGYNHCGTFFHTHLPEGRVGNTVLVSCRWYRSVVF